MSAGEGEPTAGALIDARIAELGDWRGAALAHVRSLIRRAIDLREGETPDAEAFVALVRAAAEQRRS